MNKKLNGLGEIVTWTSPKSVPLGDLRTAMIDSEIDPELVKDMHPSNAFRRALHQLEENRVIRQTKNQDGELHFQFTQEYMSGGEFHYRKETDVMLDKKTGIVRCDDYAIEKHAQQLIDEQSQHRTGSDVTVIVKRLFERNGDLFPLRESGGVYFVPDRHIDLSDKVEKMLQLIGGDLNRWEMESTPRNTANAAVAVRDELQRMIEDYTKYSLNLKSDDPNVMSKGMTKINEIRMKMNAYSGLLSSYAGKINSALDAVTRDLSQIAGMPVANPISDSEYQERQEPADALTIEAIFAGILG